MVMKEQSKKTAYMKVDPRLHRALKIASVHADKSLQMISDQVIREGMRALGIPLEIRKAS
jgi:predicted HicB family RNase H-like nuclease